MSSYSVPGSVEESFEPPVVEECFPTYKCTGMQAMRPYPKYKDSGVEWIGKVPEEWELKKLKYASFINPTKEATLDKNSDELVTFLPMENVSESGQICCNNKKPISSMWSGFTHFKKDDVIVAKITPCFENGKGALLNNLDTEIGFGSTEFHVLRAIENVSPAFLFYVTRTYQFRLLGEAFMSGAAGQKRVSTDFLENFFVALPTLSEQTAIAAYLDRKTAEIDSLIANKERLIALYEEERTAVINQAVTKGLDLNAEMKDSGVEWLGEIPKHWEAVRLKLCISAIDQGWSPQCETQPAESNEWGVLKVGCVNGDRFDALQNKKLPDILSPRLECKIQPNDIIVSRANIRELVGLAALIEDDYPNILLCDKLYRFKSRDDRANAKFLVYYIRSSTSRIQIEERTSGASSSMQNISQSVMKDLYLALPPLEEQLSIVTHIVKKTSLIDQIITRTKQGIELFKEYRTTLISEAVTGKIDVRANG